ncbi:acyl-homoserine-lactone synthase [Bradyrhizobium sp. CCGUVB1N3]|uniref:acyl-homoserine-lactone synthase n=1 Tax=Bradyrhizobium sp. CCGUVB1N3 TaxID=2949629 RepID=UPI0035324FAD
MVESSRFCLDTQGEGRGGRFLHEATLTMFAGIIEWSMNGFDEFATATDLRVERILMTKLGSATP